MSTKKKTNPSLKILLTIVLLIAISILGYLLIKEKNAKDSPNTQDESIVEVNKDLVSLIPEKYEVIEKNSEPLNTEDDGCVFLYEIYPKEYTEIEKEYLDNAALIYCENINTAVLRGQVDEVRYSQVEGKWMYGGSEPLEEKEYGGNLVSIVALGGSHAMSNYYIVKIENSDELVILSIPIENRIRCEAYEDGIEIVKEDCVDFITSMGMPSDSRDFVPEKIYGEYYNDLLEILNNI